MKQSQISNINIKMKINYIKKHSNECKSACIECIRENEVCDAFRNKGQQFTDPSLRACNHCLNLGKKCTLLVALGLSMDMH